MRGWSLLLLSGCLVNKGLYEERLDALGGDCDGGPVWADEDGDGWGAGEPLDCGGEGVANGRDCDDSDPELTGRIGLFCPADFADDAVVVPVDGVELLVTYGADTGLYRAAAADRCEAWGGELADLSADVRVEAVAPLLVDGWVGHTAAIDGQWPDGTTPPRCPSDPGPPGDDLLAFPGCFLTAPRAHELDPEVVCERPVPDPTAWNGVGEG